MKRLYCSLLLALSLAGSTAGFAQVPLSSAFTYQGELRVAGSPANNSFDMEFRLFNASVAGAQVGPTVSVSAVAVSNGLFSTSLDFGAAQFAGEAQWLEIRIKPAGAGNFETLTPRTPLTAAPYAWAARNALADSVTGLSVVDGSLSGGDIANDSLSVLDLAPGSVGSSELVDGAISVDDINTNQIQQRVSQTCAAGSSIREISAGGTVTCEPDDGGTGGGGTVTQVATGAGLTGGPIVSSGTIAIASGGVTSAMIADGTVANADLAANAVNASIIVDGSVGASDINSAQVQTRVASSCSAGSSISAIAANGTVSCETDDVGSAGWSLTGNAGTNPSTQFIGTTDAQALVLRAGNSASIRIIPSSSTSNVVMGSPSNTVSATGVAQTVAGGLAGNSCGLASCANSLTGDYSTIAGGVGNRQTGAGLAVFVGGGGNHTIAGDYAAIGGGQANRVEVPWGTVAGGEDNAVRGSHGAIGGGNFNSLNASAATVAGGVANQATGAISMIPGGETNCAGGNYSFAAGRNAKVRYANGTSTQGGCLAATSSGDTSGDEGTFVWADSQATVFSSSGPNQFLARADGGVAFNTNSIGNFDDLVVGARSASGDADADLVLRARNGTNARIFAQESSGGLVMNALAQRFAIGTNTIDSARWINTGANGAHLTTGGAWTNGSSRLFKDVVGAIDSEQVLKRVLALGISRWRYKDSQEGEHMGPMAEDFRAAFGLGADAQHIATVDADGVALAAIQGLNQKLENENAALKADLDALRSQVEVLQRAVNGGRP
jgi:hypothetical protein